jgi:hypothetical protein
MKEYYIYRHIRPDLDVPFYIGIGTKQPASSFKAQYERAFVFYKRSSAWGEVFNKNNHNISVEIVFESTSFDQILDKEKEFIALYGQIKLGGNLVNLTAGGQGTKSYTLTPEHKEKIRKGILALKLKRSEETRRKISEANKGKKRTQEVIEANRRRGKKRTHSEETKRKIGNAHLGMKRPEETGRRISAANKGRSKARQSQEVINKRAAKMVGRQLSPETRRRISDSLTGKPLSDAHKQKLRNAWIRRKEVRNDN